MKGRNHSPFGSVLDLARIRETAGLVDNEVVVIVHVGNEGHFVFEPIALMGARPYLTRFFFPSLQRLRTRSLYAWCK